MPPARRAADEPGAHGVAGLAVLAAARLGQSDPWALDAAAFAAVWRECGGVPALSSSGSPGSGPRRSRSPRRGRVSSPPSQRTPARRCTRSCSRSARRSRTTTSIPFRTPTAARCSAAGPRLGGRAAHRGADHERRSGGVLRGRAQRREAARRRAEAERGIRRQLAKLDAEVALRAREAGPEEEAAAALLQAAGTVLTTGATDALPRGRPASRSSTPRPARPAKCRWTRRLACGRTRRRSSPARANPPSCRARGAEAPGAGSAQAATRGGAGARRRRRAGGRRRRPAAAGAPGIPPGVRGKRRLRRKAMPGIREYRSGEGGVFSSARAAPGTTGSRGGSRRRTTTGSTSGTTRGARRPQGAGADPPGRRSQQRVRSRPGTAARAGKGWWTWRTRGAGTCARSRAVPGKVLLGESATVRVRPGVPHRSRVDRVKRAPVAR